MDSLSPDWPKTRNLLLILYISVILRFCCPRGILCFYFNRLDTPAIALRRVVQEHYENAELRHDNFSGNDCGIISIHFLELLAVRTR